MDVVSVLLAFQILFLLKFPSFNFSFITNSTEVGLLDSSLYGGILVISVR